MKTYFQLLFPPRRIKLNLLLTSCKKKKKKRKRKVHLFILFLYSKTECQKYLLSTHKICMYWLVVLSPKDKATHPFYNIKYLYYLNKEALSGLLKVPFANDQYPVWAGQLFVHAAWRAVRLRIKIDQWETNSKPVQLSSSWI